MKKFMLALVAATTFATPAFAQVNYGTATYGQDAQGWYQMNANGQTFCRFGTLNHGNGASANSTVTATGFGGAQEADGTFTLDIQNDNNDTVQSAFGQYAMDNVVCNTPFTVTAVSDNGGLKAANTTSDPAFAQVVPYQVRFSFDGLTGTNVTVSTSSQTTLTGNEARAGAAALNVFVPASNLLVLQGAYSDRLVLTMTPNI